LNIALVYDIARWEERAILEAARKRSIRVELLHLETQPLTVSGRPPVEADVYLQRCLSHANALSSTIALESTGVRVVNNSRAIVVAHDKLWTLALLSKAGIPTPRTVIAFSESSAMKAAGALGYPVVVKPINGSWGRLVSLAEDEETLRVILEHRVYMNNPFLKVHLIQEFVRKPGRDIRVFVVGDEVPVAIYRVSDHWVTNTARGGRAQPAPIDEELRELSLKTAETLGVEIAGLDVFEDPERGYLVNEVNAVPDFRNTVAVTGYDLPGKIVEYLASTTRR
jgi:[lysine-biosynthesis-protein LysW]--L-2-aminoadipate ligase